LTGQGRAEFKLWLARIGSGAGLPTATVKDGSTAGESACFIDSDVPKKKDTREGRRCADYDDTLADPVESSTPFRSLPCRGVGFVTLARPSFRK
jgi:hypothetical protein